MKGLELSRKFFEQYGVPLLDGAFSDVRDRIAVGLVGEGSEVAGFDDEFSRDHDFEPGFCFLVTREDDAAFGFRLARAYAKLPREFMGQKRLFLSPVGGARHGVMVIEDFFLRTLGVTDIPQSLSWWMQIPSTALFAATAGEIFRDPRGIVSEIRGKLSFGYPEDVRRKKLAAHTAMMAQAGQYNYMRSVARGERGAAALSIAEFVRHAISAIYLINNRYEPFYKWAFRGMRDLPILSAEEAFLSTLSEGENVGLTASEKQERIEAFAARLGEELRREELSAVPGAELEAHAVAISRGIRDAELRNLHLMAGI